MRSVGAPGTRLLVRSCRRFAADDSGTSLVEISLSVSILGLSLVALLQVFAALGLSAGHLDRATAAEGVANSVAESILDQAYAAYPGTYSTTVNVANPRAYTVAVQIEYASNPAAVGPGTPPSFSVAPAADYGLQRITVTVTPTQGGEARTARVLKRR